MIPLSILSTIDLSSRQEALQAANVFDEVLGAGGPLHSSEDLDMTYRVLRAVASAQHPDATVLHDGFRSSDETLVLIRLACFSLGATYLKYVRRGDLAMLPTLLSAWWVRCVSWKKGPLLRRASGLGNFLYYLRGMLTKFRPPIDRRRWIYVPR